MSFLQKDSQDSAGLSSQGEELTKGSSHLVLTAIVAAILVTAAVFLFVKFGEKPPAATGELLEVWAHPRHVDTKGYDANGAPIPVEHIDQVLIFAHVRIHNQSKGPLQFEDALANVTLNDGIHSISAGTKSQYEQVFIAYPEIASFKQTSFSPTQLIQPGETVEGTVLWGAQMTKKDWEARKALDFAFRIQFQPLLKLTPTAAITEK